MSRKRKQQFDNTNKIVKTTNIELNIKKPSNFINSNAFK